MFCDATRAVVLEHAEKTHRSLLSNMSGMGSQVFLSATGRRDCFSGVIINARAVEAGHRGLNWRSLRQEHSRELVLKSLFLYFYSKIDLWDLIKVKLSGRAWCKMVLKHWQTWLCCMACLLVDSTILYYWQENFRFGGKLLRIIYDGLWGKR